MKKIHGAWLACMLITLSAAGQDKDYTKQPTIGVHFFLNDYQSAAKIRSSSLSSVLQNKEFGRLKAMDAGLAVNYMKGFNKNFDLSVTAAGSFVSYDIKNRPGTAKERFLLEVDASVMGKMVSDRYWLSPYVQLGIGASKYGVYYGAFVPAGVGLQVNFFDEAYLMINSQYRIPITETAAYHFYHSLGIAGNIGKKSEPTAKKSVPSLPFAKN